MMQRDEQLKRRLKAAAFGAALVLVGAATPSVQAGPSALELAAQKRAAAAQPQATSDKTSNAEAASFDPFAAGSTAPAVAAAAAPAPQASGAEDEAAKRLAARQAVLAKLGAHRPSFLVQIMQVRATRRSPNTPPDFTPRRPSDPPGPPANVPPGPPPHAPPGKPEGTPGNGPNN